VGPWAFAAIGIGAMGTAAIMSIRRRKNWQPQYLSRVFRTEGSERPESQMAKWVSLYRQKSRRARLIC